MWVSQDRQRNVREESVGYYQVGVCVVFGALPSVMVTVVIPLPSSVTTFFVLAAGGDYSAEYVGPRPTYVKSCEFVGVW